MSRREDVQRRKVAKRLMEEINQTTDPKMLLKLVTQYNEVKPKGLGRPRKEAPTPPLPSQQATVPRAKTGTFVDKLSDEDYQIHLVVDRAEQLRRKNGTSSKEAVPQAFSELVAEGAIKAEDLTS